MVWWSSSTSRPSTQPSAANGGFDKFEEACKDMVKYLDTHIKALVGARRALQRMIGSVAPCRK